MLDFAHATARVCNVPATRAMTHLTSAEGMARWNLGLRNCRESMPGLFTGISLFDSAQAWIRIVAVDGMDAVDYHVGPSPEQLVARIHARVIPGELLGYGSGTCVVTLLAWRPLGMTDERWTRLVATHETEVALIQAQLDSEAGA